MRGDEKQRSRILEAIKSAVGKKAAEYLYINTETKNGTTKYYVGIKTGGPSGKGPDFSSMNPVARDIGAMITSSKVASIQVVQQGARIGNTVVSSNPEMCNCNAVGIGATQPVDKNHVLVSLPLPEPGDAYDRAGWETTLPIEMSGDGVPGNNDAGINVAHELGHGKALLNGAMPGSIESDRSALDFENKVRKLRDSKAATRDYHGERRALRNER